MGHAWRKESSRCGFLFLNFFQSVMHELQSTVISSQVCCGNAQRQFTAPFVDDGLVEVVGFRDAWHGLVLLAPNGHGTRIAQV